MPNKAKNDQTGGKRRSPRTCSVSSETALTDRQRWEACGKPEIICHDDGEDRACYHIGEDRCCDRCCELCGRDEPEEETSECPDCEVEVWWVPKCPDCGKPATWTYGEIKPLEFEAIKSSQNSLFFESFGDIRFGI